MNHWRKVTLDRLCEVDPIEVADGILGAFGAKPWPQRQKEESTLTTRAVQGQRGTDEQGYRWRAFNLLDEAAITNCSLHTYGLPGLELEWRWNLLQSGYSASPVHESVRVRWASEDERRRFCEAWRRHFGRDPICEEEAPLRW